MNLRMLPAAPGLCSACASKHGELQPHNFWSIFYQTRFKMRYKRDVTHADCLAHLSPEYRTRAYQEGQVSNMDELVENFANGIAEYKAILKANGKEWSEPPEGVDPVPEPYACN